MEWREGCNGIERRREGDNDGEKETMKWREGGNELGRT